MIFDLNDNIFVCNKKNKIKQIRFGGGEIRDIELDGISILYIVVFYFIGEKMFVLDFYGKCCVY